MINSQFAKDRTTGLLINSAVDYSTTPEDFILAPVNEVWNVTRMIFSLTDSGVLDSGFWGATNAALTNGIKMEVWKGGKASGSKIFDLFADFPIKENGQWGAACFDVDPLTFGSGNSWLVVRYTFSKDTGSSDGIVLDGYNGDELVIPLSDDFSGLVGQYFRFGINDK